MEISEIIKLVKSGIIQFLFTNNGQYISSGSGFISNNKLISNNHIFFDDENHPLSNGVDVHLRFGDMLDTSPDALIIKYGQFMANLVEGSTRENADYAIFNVPQDFDISGKYQLEISDHRDIQEGEQILFMGFPFGIKYLTSHVG